jgi:RNA polymerase sigma-70 factor (family 1)
MEDVFTTTNSLAHFDALYQQYHQAVYANIAKMVRQPQTAEDILQEVFLALWENRAQLDADRVAGWLFVVSYNKSASWLKKKLKEPAILLQEVAHNIQALDDTAEEEALYRLKLSIVEEAVSRLPERKKEVFRLCRFEGRSYDEAAELLGISAASVKDYLKQSTRFIRDYVTRHHGTLDAAGAGLLLLYITA